MVEESDDPKLVEPIEFDWESATAEQRETFAKIDAFLADPSTGVERVRVGRPRRKSA